MIALLETLAYIAAFGGLALFALGLLCAAFDAVQGLREHHRIRREEAAYRRRHRSPS